MADNSRKGTRLPNYTLAPPRETEEEEAKDDSREPIADDSSGRRKFNFFRKKAAATAAANRTTPNDEAEMRTTSQVLDKAIVVNVQTAAALDHTEKMMNEAENIGVETVQHLQRGRDNIATIDNSLATMEPLGKRMRKDISAFARGLARDKCFLVLTFLVVGLLIAVIVTSEVDVEEPLERLKLDTGDIPKPNLTTFATRKRVLDDYLLDDVSGAE